MKKFLNFILFGICAAAVFGGCGKVFESNHSVEAEPIFEDAITIELSDETILVNGEEISTDEGNSVYKANDIVYYEEGHNFTYGEGTKEDEHSKEDADKHTVVHITKPGNYVVSGELSYGQLAIDLGEDAKNDESAVVNLVLNDVDINCEVAPAVIFYNVYECGIDEVEDASKDVDTSKAGANVYIADDTENNVTGSYVARIYESYELSEDGTEVVDSKKLHKYDAAFYSKRTMNINGGTKGNGILNIVADNEGLDSELHLTINGGFINIESGNDGINTNEDEVSVTTVNGGNLNILVNGSTGEGDGIDSNGWLVINGGTVIAQACSDSGDAGIDSDMGIHINGGSVIATGNMLDRISESTQTYAVFSFANRQQENNTYILKNEADATVFEFENTNAFTYMILAGDTLTEGDYTLWCNDMQCEGSSQGGCGMGGPGESGGHRKGEEFEAGAGFENEVVFGDGKMQRPEQGEMPEGIERQKDMGNHEKGALPN
ncbi:MAG: carbohydrate-binding domain-containing protein, partial [Lachnospiraceae bacterium]|nr:carbohydrate-binding domain-containing protein [Lachnospiraceae bacterium]